MSLTEALGGFGKFWEPLGSFGRVLKGHGSPSPRLWEVLKGFGMLRKALGGFGRHGKALGGFWMFWDDFGRLAASVRLSLALVQWMLWKVLEALGVFERYGRLLEDFRKL